MVGELFTYRLSALRVERFAINQGLPAMRWILDREKGYHLFLSLMRSFEPAPDGGGSAHCVPQRLADASGVSRNTARNFIGAGFEQGWMRPAAGHRLTLSPAFVDEAMHWFGLEFVWMHTLACAAWERVTRERPQPGPGSAAGG